MFLSNVSLFDFRNYAELDLTLERSSTVFFGGNAQGKTNLLEAVGMLALTRSPRTQQAADLVRFGQPAARVSCEVQTDEGRDQLELRVNLARSPTDPTAPSQSTAVRASRRFTVNGMHRRSSDMLGALRVVLFWPDDLQLIKGPGEGRRRFLNTLLSQLDAGHARELNRYGHLLEQRNALLRGIRENRQPLDALDYWTDALAESGATIMVDRQRRLLELQPIAAAFHRELSDDRERLELRYRPAGARIGEAPRELVVEQLKAAMREARDEEIGRGQTAVGPQRDDVEMWLDDHEARLFASQGQQRSAVLSLKLAELHYLAEATGEQPVLLLDDVMSELDPARRERLLAALQPGPQALITAADLNDLPKSILERAAVFRVERGTIHA
ncbi:MAG TPA: DNA replication/repair protein RecF [Candidatus Dormibacteraeota bacterium]|nr:DNA replication/repair protein RecF [Candidatus Dormibacteraeota bacterium]